MKRYQLKTPATGILPADMPPELSLDPNPLLASAYACLAQAWRSRRCAPVTAEELLADVMARAIDAPAPSLEDLHAQLQRLRELRLVTVSHSV